jgi:phosphopantetheinyl transferase (holo-ACP synthase)
LIGNDIVDLLLSRIESNWQRKGWLQKIFCPEELTLISDAGDKEELVWLLWSMKESAYKIINRQTHIASYNPKSLQCSNIRRCGNTAQGMIRYGDRVLYSQSTISTEFIHTITTLQNNCTDINVYIWNESDNSPLSSPDRLIRKDEYGLPYLPDPIQGKRPVSKSHHGRFGAIVF